MKIIMIFRKIIISLATYFAPTAPEGYYLPVVAASSSRNVQNYYNFRSSTQIKRAVSSSENVSKRQKK